MIESALDQAGLYTFPNPLTKVPVGALLQADNLVINKDGISESRRGVSPVGSELSLTAGQYVDQFFGYQDRLLIHTTTDTLQYDSTGGQVWSTFSGTYTAPTGAYKMRGIEANKNFYLTSSDGVYKLDSYSSTPMFSGGLPGLDGSGILAGDGAGFLGANFQCAYQIVFGYTDLNGNLILGNPSERILVVNSTAGADNVTLSFTLPQGITTNWFYQIYRTPQTAYSAVPASNVPPGAELQLSTQQQITGAEVSALSATYTDITPDDLLGAFLYTNPSQEGSFQTNDRAPLCVDFCLFSQMIFYANCETLQNTFFNLISVGAPNGIVNGDTITINNVLFTAAFAQNNPAQQFEFVTSGTVSQNIDDTARNLVACINANASMTNVYAFYISGYNSLPGQIQLQAIDFSQGEFYVTSSNGEAFSPVLPLAGTTFASSNDSTPNGIYVSKVSQPEAVPVVNLLFIGGGDQPILRVLTLRDRVVVLKTDGIYVITGQTPQNLTVTLLDSTILCIASESAQLLNNSVYCMTNQGVVSVTESGVTIQSRPIEADLLSLTGPSFINFPSATSAVGYESERLYILSVPTEPADTYGTQQYCYNWITNAWTRWTLDMAAGIINPDNNFLYLSRPTWDQTYVYRERKSYTYEDFYDNSYDATIVSIDSTGLIVTISGTPDADWVGYGLVQTNAGTAIITAIDVGAKTITVDIDDSTNPGEALVWTAGSVAIQVPIDLAVTHCPLTGGSPHMMKNWTRINFWFNSGNFNQIRVAYQTDVTGLQGDFHDLYSAFANAYGYGPYGNGPYGALSNYPQAIQDMALGVGGQARWIMPSLELSFPGARFSYMGTTVSQDIISDVAG